jgi:hypothetical protein
VSEVLADWQTGQVIDLRGRKKVLLAAGVMSKTGDARRQFGSFTRYLQREHGYVQGDFLEATYRGSLRGAEWMPQVYQTGDCEAPLAESSGQIVQLLRWYDRRLPIDVELHLIGYSLGGVVLFRAAAELVREDRACWSLRLRSVNTLASPHFGSDLGLEGELLGFFGFHDLFIPGGAVGRELCSLGGDPTHRQRVERDAQLLRSAGIRLLTLADEYDTVVTPEDSVIAPAAERSRFTLATSRYQQAGAYADAVLGHGPLLDNPKAWRLLADQLGPQEPRLRTATGAIPL